MQDVVETIDTQIAEEEGKLNESKTRIKSLRKARAALLNANESTNGHKTYDPEKAAGEQNIANVANYLYTKKEARQVDIQRDLKLNSGTVSCALQVLDKRNQAEAGPRVNRSKKWKWVGKRPTVKVKRSSRKAVAA